MNSGDKTPHPCARPSGSFVNVIVSAMLDFVHVFRAGGRIVVFGFLLAFLSSFGQTFFIALFGQEIRTAFDLSHGEFGSIFSMATLCSGLLMIWVGAALDRIPAGTYAAVALAGLAGAGAGLALAPNPFILFIVLFCLRLFGQGMLGHAAATTMARLPTSIRGKAVGVSVLGHATGEAVLPVLGVILIGMIGWMDTWFAVAGLLIVAIALKPGRLLSDDRGILPPTRGMPTVMAFRRRDILRDWRFYLFLPSVAAMPAIGTGFFFHQRLIADLKGWPLSVLATSISAYAVASLLAAIIGGILVDRFRAVTLTPVYLFPLILGMIVLATVTHPVAAFLVFSLLGLSAGSSGIIATTVWAEMYGTENLGTIRSMAVAVMVVSTAATPGVMGLLMDGGVSLPVLAFGAASAAIVISILNLRLVLAVMHRKRMT